MYNIYVCVCKPGRRFYPGRKNISVRMRLLRPVRVVWEYYDVRSKSKASRAGPAVLDRQDLPYWFRHVCWLEDRLVSV